MEGTLAAFELSFGVHRAAFEYEEGDIFLDD